MKCVKLNLDLISPSFANPLICKDGEVMEWFGMPRFEPADKDDKDSQEIIALLNFSDLGISLPAGSRLLAVHSPLSENGKSTFLIYLSASREIYFTPFSADGTKQLIGYVPRNIGSLQKVRTFKDLVVLIGKSGIAWLLYKSDDESYSLLPSLPEAPQVTFEMDDAYLFPYTALEGSDPVMEVEVDLHEYADLIDSVKIAGWLTAGNAEGIDYVVKDTIYEAVSERISKYVEDVRRAGFYLSPVACVAALGEALPGNRTISENNYAPPVARLISWNLHSVTLTLKIAFNLRPSRLSATFNLSQSQLKWLSLFPELCLYVSKEMKWWIADFSGKSSAPEVTGLTSYSNGEFSGLAFKFRAYAKSEIKSFLNRSNEYYICKSVELATLSGGTVILSVPDDESKTFVPDYTDFEPVIPTASCLTDEGVIIAQGNLLLTPMKENGVVYRFRNIISDGDIIEVVQSFVRGKGSNYSRHTLTVFSVDGIRQAESDNAGGYVNVKMLSKLSEDNRMRPGLSDYPISRTACIRSAVWFITPAGIEKLSSSSHRLLSGFPDGLKGEDVISMRYHRDSDTIILTTFYTGVWLYKVNEDEWCTAGEVPVGFYDTITDEMGDLLSVDENSHVSRLNIEYFSSDRGASDSFVENNFTEAMWTNVNMNGKCGLLTRPLKFGDIRLKKRISNLFTAVPTNYRIEGSDDMMTWHILSEGSSPRCSLHTAAYRFLRLRLIADKVYSGLLDRIGLTVILI